MPHLNSFMLKFLIPFSSQNPSPTFHFSKFFVALNLRFFFPLKPLQIYCLSRFRLVLFLDFLQFLKSISNIPFYSSFCGFEFEVFKKKLTFANLLSFKILGFISFQTYHRVQNSFSWPLHKCLKGLCMSMHANFPIFLNPSRWGWPITPPPPWILPFCSYYCVT
jgi:hypothetical protein